MQVIRLRRRRNAHATTKEYCRAVRSQHLEPCQKFRRDLLLYVLIPLFAGRIVVFPAQQHLLHCLLITPERAGIQSLIRRVVVGVVQIIVSAAPL